MKTIVSTAPKINSHLLYAPHVRTEWLHGDGSVFANELGSLDAPGWILCGACAESIGITLRTQTQIRCRREDGLVFP